MAVTIPTGKSSQPLIGYMKMPLDIKRIRGLCFDVDGTLSDTDDMFVRRLVHWLTPVRFLFPLKNPHPVARRMVMATETPANKLYGLFDRMGIDDEISKMGEFIYRLGLGRSPEPFMIIAGIHHMLDQLQHHYPLSIVSARGQSSTLRFLEQFNLRGYFCCVATAHTCKHTKPFPDPIHWAAVQMGITAETCLMIGDTTVDIKAGKAAGAQTVGVLCGFGQEEELRSAGADLILDSTALVADTLLNSPF
jgi:phosphoglycolate phosphatase-like HAD superfamily hydrolase